MNIITMIQKNGVLYVKNAIVSQLRKIIFVFFVTKTCKKDKKLSYSQYAEDLFLDKHLGYKDTGSYIDVGANDPNVLSNTKRFYERGWRGVNVEPNLHLYEDFCSERPEDINLNIGVGGADTKELLFYVVEPHTLSTFDKETAKELKEMEGVTITEEKKVKIKSLQEVFKVLDKKYVDFLSIDTEGYDQVVLESNDWDTYRAKIICLEDHSGSQYTQFLSVRGYKKMCTNGLNTFFIDENSK